MSLKEQIREKYETTKNQVSEKVYSTRSYANFYGGPVLAAGGNIAFFRYTTFTSYDSPVSEVLKWAGATVISLPFQLFALPIGLALGITSTFQLAESRARKKRKLELTLESR